ncbi:MAG: hypothetical protein AAF394_08280, partial [Planctomycetota bacterium]
PSDGQYTLIFEGSGDAVGAYGWVLWQIPQATARSIQFGSVATGAISVPGQTAVFEISGGLNQTVTFDEIHLAGSTVSYTLLAPSGAEVFTSVTEDTVVGSLPEEGIYRLIVDADGDTLSPFSFRIVDGQNLPAVPAAADLVVSEVIAPRTLVGKQLQANLNWTLTNAGEATIPAGTQITDSNRF